jgi:hypothetical protein
MNKCNNKQMFPHLNPSDYIVGSNLKSTHAKSYVLRRVLVELPRPSALRGSERG